MVLPHVNCFIKRIKDIIEVNYIYTGKLCIMLDIFFGALFYSTIFGYVVAEFHLSCIMKQTSFHNCIMNKTDIVHALNQYVGKLNIVLKTFKKTTNIG
jgi:hypothetical protein